MERNTEGWGIGSSIFQLWVPSRRRMWISRLESVSPAIEKLYTGKCPGITRPIPTEPTSESALFTDQCLNNTSTYFWKQIWTQDYMHWGTGHERYHRVVSWRPVPNPQLWVKAYNRKCNPWPQAEFISRDAETAPVSHEDLCNLNLDTQFLVLE